MSFDKEKYDDIHAKVHGKLSACFNIALDELLTHQDCHANDVTVKFLLTQREEIKRLEDEAYNLIKAG